MKITSAEFITSAVKQTQYPLPSLPEVAFAGRSNVGKSSLINTLVNRKHLVKTSSRPGRTQTLNFFLIIKRVCFVDLPGYGFADVPLKLRAQWKEMLEGYLRSRQFLKLVVTLLDIRRAAGTDDASLIRWLEAAAIPFLVVLTKADYQNLVRCAYPDAYESVHHTEWPKADTSVINEKLIYQIDLARRIASLGLSARNNSNLKVRQPLAKVLVHVREGSAELPADLVEIVADELNVKAIEYITNLESVVRYKVLPNNKLLGPKFGANFRQVSELLRIQDPYQVAAKVAAGEVVILDLNGEAVYLSSEEILVSTESVAGLAVAADKLVTVAIDTTLTPELIAEGLAREIVRRIQTQRKNADFNIEDRITTWYVADEMVKVFADWSDYIQSETLTTELIAGEPPAEAFLEKHKIEGTEIVIGLKRN